MNNFLRMLKLNGIKMARMDECDIMYGIEGGRWHISISHKTRYPIYDEIKQARYKYIPDKVTMAMIFPSKDEFVNIHPNCFHLWEIEKL